MNPGKDSKGNFWEYWGTLGEILENLGIPKISATQKPQRLQFFPQTPSKKKKAQKSHFSPKTTNLEQIFFLFIPVFENFWGIFFGWNFRNCWKENSGGNPGKFGNSQISASQKPRKLQFPPPEKSTKIQFFPPKPQTSSKFILGFFSRLLENFGGFFWVDFQESFGKENSGRNPGKFGKSKNFSDAETPKALIFPSKKSTKIPFFPPKNTNLQGIFWDFFPHLFENFGGTFWVEFQEFLWRNF